MKAELEEVKTEIHLALSDVLRGVQRIMEAMQRAENIVEALPDEPLP